MVQFCAWKSNFAVAYSPKLDQTQLLELSYLVFLQAAKHSQRGLVEVRSQADLGRHPTIEAAKQDHCTPRIRNATKIFYKCKACFLFVVLRGNLKEKDIYLPISDFVARLAFSLQIHKAIHQGT